MFKKIVLCSLFFSVSPLILAVSVYFCSFWPSGRVLGQETVSPSAGQVLAALPNEAGVVDGVFKVEEATPVIIDGYLRHYNSPLLPYVENIVSAGEKYSVSPLLIVAIAQQESNLGKKSPLDCYNAWGWAIHERGTKCFTGWAEAIGEVTKGIANGYCHKGLCDDPCVMMKKYTPKSNGSWCAGVNQFLREMEMGKY